MPWGPFLSFLWAPPAHPRYYFCVNGNTDSDIQTAGACFMMTCMMFTCQMMQQQQAARDAAKAAPRLEVGEGLDNNQHAFLYSQGIRTPKPRQSVVQARVDNAVDAWGLRK